MSASAILPDPIDWSGDNPCIYLRDRADGPYTALASWFRVAVSRHGAGHALVVVADPQRAGVWPEVATFCLADNPRLARDLVSRFLSRFAAFRDLPSLAAMPFLPLDGHEASGDGSHVSRIVAHGSAIEVDLLWNALGKPFLVDLPPQGSATGAHRMLSVFSESADAAIIVNGQRLPGRPFPRPFAGSSMSSAFLASSETWLEVAVDASS
jgi:hypothetical protein